MRAFRLFLLLAMGLLPSGEGSPLREPQLVRPAEPELVRPSEAPPLRRKRRVTSRQKTPKAQKNAVDEALRARIRDAALRASLDPKLVEAVVSVESNGERSALSNKGAMGLMQVIPSTADACEIHDPYNTVNNLMGACDCLRKLINRYRGNTRLALAAYNAGPKNVDRYGGIPPFTETKSYVKKIMTIYHDLKHSSARIAGTPVLP